MNDRPIAEFRIHHRAFKDLRVGDRFGLSFSGPIYVKKNDDLAYRLSNEKAIRYFKPEQEVHDYWEYNFSYNR
jgi:hypothetical protein